MGGHDRRDDGHGVRRGGRCRNPSRVDPSILYNTRRKPLSPAQSSPYTPQSRAIVASHASIPCNPRLNDLCAVPVLHLSVLFAVFVSYCFLCCLCADGCFLCSFLCSFRCCSGAALLSPISALLLCCSFHPFSSPPHLSSTQRPDVLVTSRHSPHSSTLAPHPSSSHLQLPSTISTRRSHHFSSPPISSHHSSTHITDPSTL
jgi:hypothetical protein